MIGFALLLSFSGDPQLLIPGEPQETTREMKDGMAALQARDFRTALEKFQRLEKLTPSDPQVLYFLCASYFGVGDQERALAVASKLSGGKQGDAALYGNLGILCAEHGVARCAIDAFKAGLEKDPGVYDLAYNLALAYSRNGDATNTVKVLEGVRHPPADSDYYRLLGTSYGSLDKPEKAVELLRRSVDLDRKNEHAQYDLGMLLIAQKKDQEAVAVFQEAVKYCPRSSKVRTGLGLSYYLTGNNKGAEAAFLKGVELDPSSAAAYGDLAEFYMAAGNLDQALTVYDKGVRIDPTNVDLRYKYAVALNRRNRAQDAADQLVKALGSDANHAQSLSLLGRIRLNQGKPEEAVALLEKAVAALPAERETRYSLIRAYQAIGARDKADRQVEILRSLPATPAKERRAP